MTCVPVPVLSGAELLEWIALRRVCGGGVALVGNRWFDLGRLVPGYLPDTLDGLHRDRLIALAEIDGWGLRRVAATRAGRTRYVELSAKRTAPGEPPTGRSLTPDGRSGQGLDRPPPDDQPPDRRSVEAGEMTS